MRLPRIPPLRFQLPTLSATAHSNCWVTGIFIFTLGWIAWGTYPKPAGAYRGAAIPQLSEFANHTEPAMLRQDSSPASAGRSDSALKVEGKLALRMKQALLLDAKAKLQTIPDYFATFVRQERVGKKLLNRETTELKIRHSPFSVYMKWHEGSDVGRELLFINGMHDGRLVVSPGSVLPTVKLDPSGDLAMAESRYPVTESGILNLVEKILTYCERDLKLDEGVSCQFLSEQKFDGKLCHVIRTDYDCAEIDPEYHSSIVYLEKESLIPLCIKNYGWPDRCGMSGPPNDQLNDATLLEFYAFTGLRYQVRLSATEFDQNNSNYRFHR